MFFNINNVNNEIDYDHFNCESYRCSIGLFSAFSFIMSRIEDTDPKLDGGFIMLGKETSGTIQTIPAGGEETVSSDLILGFGKTVVTVTAEVPDSSHSRQRGGTVLLFFIKINPGGG